jgi:hypothetical protein
MRRLILIFVLLLVGSLWADSARLKVTDPAKMVTEPSVLTILSAQGIDKDYVELHEDYSAASPTTKTYKVIDSNMRIATIGTTPMVCSDGQKISAVWVKEGDTYTAGKNLFEATVNGLSVQLSANGVRSTWSPTVTLDGREQTSSTCSLIDDYFFPDVSGNCLIWDYGICKRVLRLTEGSIFEYYIFDANPAGDVIIKANLSGDLKFQNYWATGGNKRPLRGFKVGGDEKIISKDVWDKATFPVTVDDSFSTATNQVTFEYFGSTSDYAAIQAAATCTDLISEYNYAGQNDSLGDLYLDRCGLIFNTSTIPANATITSVSLTLYADNGSLFDTPTNMIACYPSDFSTSNSYPHSPPVVADYEQSKSVATGSNIASSAWVDTDQHANTWDLGSAWLNYIKIGSGVTKVYLRTIREINVTVPSGAEFFNFYSSNSGALSPSLTVTYTTPPAGGGIPTVISQIEAYRRRTQ